jgi:hypothetical protein
MKKNSFLWILVALVVFFFVFGMGTSVYEGFTSCTVNSDCPQKDSGGKTYCGACTRGFCQAGRVKVKKVPCT